MRLLALFYLMQIYSAVRMRLWILLLIFPVSASSPLLAGEYEPAWCFFSVSFKKVV